MATKGEAKFTSKLKQFVEAKQGFYFKVHGGMMQKSGVPDVFVALNGFSVWLELKDEKNPLQLNQRLVIRKMKQNGCNAFVLRHSSGRILVEDEDGMLLTFAGKMGDPASWLPNHFEKVFNWMDTTK